MAKTLQLDFSGGVNVVSAYPKAKKDQWERLQGVVSRPYGAVEFLPDHSQVWECPLFDPGAGPDSAFITAHSITTSTKTACFRISGEGQVFLAFWNFAKDANDQWITGCRGFFYCGTTVPDSVTWTGNNQTITKLLEGLDDAAMWDGLLVGGRKVLMGNGVDANRIYDIATPALTASGSDAIPTTPVLSTAAAGAGESGFYWKRTVRVTYFDPGSDGFGYEGRASAESAAVEIELGTAPRNLQVAVTGGGDARFTKQRIYVRTYISNSDEVHTRYVLAKEVNNTSGTHTIKVEDLPTVPALIKELPELFQGTQVKLDKFAMLGGILFGTSPAFPSRLYYSPPAEQDQKLPESLRSDLHIDIGSINIGNTAGSAITAIHEFRGRLVVHALSGISEIDPSRMAPQKLSAEQVRTILTYHGQRPAAINQHCVTRGEDGRLLFLGRDFKLYDLLATISGSVTDVTGRAGLNYITSEINIAACLDAAGHASIYSDRFSSLVLVSTNTGQSNAQNAWHNSQRLWTFDQSNKSMTGPFTHPTLFRVANRDVLDGNLIFMDANGNLRRLNVADMFDNAFTARTSPLEDFQSPLIPLTPGWRIQPHVARPTGGLHRAVLRTHWLDLGEPTKKKSITAIHLKFARYSQAFITLIVRNQEGHEITRDLFEVAASDSTHLVGGLHVEATPFYFDTITELKVPLAVRGGLLQVEIRLTGGGGHRCRLLAASVVFGNVESR